jgi:hypothetical protein
VLDVLKTFLECAGSDYRLVRHSSRSEG